MFVLKEVEDTDSEFAPENYAAFHLALHCL